MSQIATTVEQSKRLIAAGIDPKSADMTWINAFIGPNRSPSRAALLDVTTVRAERDAPAWSLSRLIDIHRNFDYGPMDNGSAAVIDCLVRSICYEIKYETGRVREEFIVKRPLGQPQETEGA